MHAECILLRVIWCTRIIIMFRSLSLLHAIFLRIKKCIYVRKREKERETERWPKERDSASLAADCISTALLIIMYIILWYTATLYEKNRSLTEAIYFTLPYPSCIDDKKLSRKNILDKKNERHTDRTFWHFSFRYSSLILLIWLFKKKSCIFLHVPVIWHIWFLVMNFAKSFRRINVSFSCNVIYYIH